ncbi:MAG: hypothetical protein L6R40_001066 [Gallowayella cf. fulva]|nr:MAG: hypothetical protein L6R40_001066 [Xanthomendoza cf. fulva]
MSHQNPYSHIENTVRPGHRAPEAIITQTKCPRCVEKLKQIQGLTVHERSFHCRLSQKGSLSRPERSVPYLTPCKLAYKDRPLSIHLHRRGHRAKGGHCISEPSATEQREYKRKRVETDPECQHEINEDTHQSSISLKKQRRSRCRRETRSSTRSQQLLAGSEETQRMPGSQQVPRGSGLDESTVCAAPPNTRSNSTSEGLDSIQPLDEDGTSDFGYTDRKFSAQLQRSILPLPRWSPQRLETLDHNTAVDDHVNMKNSEPKSSSYPPERPSATQTHVHEAPSIDQPLQYKRESWGYRYSIPDPTASIDIGEFKSPLTEEELFPMIWSTLNRELDMESSLRTDGEVKSEGVAGRDDGLEKREGSQV